MEGKILIINVGSDSIKFKIFSQITKREIADGICKRIFSDGLFEMDYYQDNEEEKVHLKSKEKFFDYNSTLDILFEKISNLKIVDENDKIVAIGHRVVHGGDEYKESCIINENVEEGIEKLFALAPIHNKHQLNVYRILKEKYPDIKNIAVFDTSFHSTIPKINTTYAIPKEWREEYNIKKYGAHGISYSYITNTIKEILKKEKVNIIVCHLGSGSSVCAIKDNNSLNTSMGLTPMSGLIMGRRSGDIDPSIHGYISKKANLSIDEINNILNNKSGMMGLVDTSDFNDIQKKVVLGNEFDFAISLFSKSVSDYVVKYINELENKVDAIVFTGGIGENDIEIRKRIIANIKISNFKISKSKNSKIVDNNTKISNFFSKKIFVIKANEELEILNEVLNLI